MAVGKRKKNKLYCLQRVKTVQRTIQSNATYNSEKLGGKPNPNLYIRRFDQTCFSKLVLKMKRFHKIHRVTTWLWRVRLNTKSQYKFLLEVPPISLYPNAANTVQRSMCNRVINPIRLVSIQTNRILFEFISTFNPHP